MGEDPQQNSSFDSQPANKPDSSPNSDARSVDGSDGPVAVPVTSGETPQSVSPQPGQTPSSPTVGTKPPRIVTSDTGRFRRSLKLLAWIIVILLIVAAAWFGYAKLNKKKPASTAAKSQDIPLIRVGIDKADFGGIYPDMANNDYGYTVNQQMFEGLVRYEDKSTIVPDLATNWANPDNNTWIFTIRQGVKFHDGHTLAASDVKYSLDKIIASNSDLAQTFASTIKDVSLAGSNKVKITTSSPDPTLLNKLAFLYVIDANLPKGDEPSQAGTGAYEIKPGTMPNTDSFQMVAFDQYHFGRPTTRAVSFSNLSNNVTPVQAYNRGQYDITGTVGPSSINQAKNADIFKVEEPDSSFIGFNTIAPGPAHNRLVREAIRYAVNAQAIGQANDEVIKPNSQLIPPSIPGYNPAITPYKQNIAKAKQLLSQAGYPHGVTMRLSVSLADVQEAQQLAKELKPVGINLVIDQHKSFDEFIDYFSSGKASMYTVDYASDTLDGLDILTTTLPTDNYDNPKVNNLLDQANVTVDPATRLKLLQQAEALVDKDIPVVPLGSTSDLWLAKKNYAIQQDTPTGYLPVYIYKVHLK